MKIIKFFKENVLRPKAKPYDLKSFKNPVALEVSWKLCKAHSSATGGKTHLATEDIFELKYSPTFKIKSIFIGMALFGLWFIFLSLWFYSEYSNQDIIISFGLGAFFTIGGIIYFPKTYVFDKTSQYLFVSKPFTKKEKHPLSSMYALQVIPLIPSAEFNDPDSSFQLNLVQDDKSRINLFFHYDRINIRDESERISKFLNIPIWDVSKQMPLI